MPPKAVPHPKSTRPNAPHTADTAAALAEYTKRNAKTGRTFKARATGTGFYGIPVPSLHHAGDVFPFAVKDLVPFVEGKRHADGTPHEKITFDGVDYALPSWVTDANKAPVVDEDESFDEENDVLADAPRATSDSVI